MPDIPLLGRTPRIRSSSGIATLEKLPLGGAEQWILIRSHDRSKPVVLFLHGGPGMPAMFLAHAFQRDLERDFVVVHWDRRGAGKSFASAADGRGFSASQTLGDTLELTRYLRERFGQPRILIVGHSWGSYLGLLAAREASDRYLAYIGTGQISGTRAEVNAARREFLLEAAARLGDSQLAARAADPAVAITEDDLFRAGGELYGSRSLWPSLLTGLAAPEYTLRDALNVRRGADLVGRSMDHNLSPRPLEGEIRQLDIPVFFFLGRYDFNTPSNLAVAYLDRLSAPLKGLAWFEPSAHFPFLEQPELFHREMLRVATQALRYWQRAPQVTP